MSDEEIKKPSFSSKSKQIKKQGKFSSFPEKDEKFNELRKKYANAIAYLLI